MTKTLLSKVINPITMTTTTFLMTMMMKMKMKIKVEIYLKRMIIRMKRMNEKMTTLILKLGIRRVKTENARRSCY